jgi:hypothetical protein
MNHNSGIHVSGGQLNANVVAAGDGAVAYQSGVHSGLPEKAPERPGSAAHRTILVVDVEGFGDQRRSNPHQLTVRRGLYRALERACARAGIPWSDCYREDRGDGLFLLAPPDVSKSAFVTSLPHELVTALREHNSTHSERAQMRLRMALHAGEIHNDEQGVAGASLNLAFRLVEADVLKSELAASAGVLAVMTSQWFFDEVVWHSAAGDPDAYRHVQVTNKETTVSAWIHVPAG